MDLTRQLAGRAVVCVLKTSNALVIQCQDGHEAVVQWVNENGEPVDGQPVVRFAGKHIRAKLGQMVAASPVERPRDLGLLLTP